MTRRLVVREMRLHPLSKFILLTRGARRELHRGDHLLAKTFVRSGHDDRIENHGVALQNFLDFFGEDFLATGVDALRPAAEQRQGAVEADRGHVARAGVAHTVNRREGRGRLGLILEVAEGEASSELPWSDCKGTFSPKAKVGQAWPPK